MSGGPTGFRPGIDEAHRGRAAVMSRAAPQPRARDRRDGETSRGGNRRWRAPISGSGPGRRWQPQPSANRQCLRDAWRRSRAVARQWRNAENRRDDHPRCRDRLQRLLPRWWCCSALRCVAARQQHGDSTAADHHSPNRPRSADANTHTEGGTRLKPYRTRCFHKVRSNYLYQGKRGGCAPAR